MNGNGTSHFRLDPRVGWRNLEPRAPADVALEPDGLRLRRLSGGGIPVTDPRGGFGGFALPTGVAVDRLGRIYLADSRAHVVRRLDPCEGRFEPLPCFEGEGSGPRQLRCPRGLAISCANHLIVADAFNHRVVVVGLHGLTIRRILGPRDQRGRPTAAPRGAWVPWDVATDPVGCIYVLDRRHGAVHRFDAQGRSLGEPITGLRRPIAIAVALPLEWRARLGALRIPLRYAGPGPATGATSVTLVSLVGTSDGDVVEFRRADGRSERRTVSRGGTDLRWSDPLALDYSRSGSLIRLVTAVRGGSAEPILELETSARGLSQGAYIRLSQGTVRESGRVLQLLGERRVRVRRDGTAALTEGATLERVTPLIFVIEEGEDSVTVLDEQGRVGTALVADLATLLEPAPLALASEGTVYAPPATCPAPTSRIPGGFTCPSCGDLPVRSLEGIVFDSTRGTVGPPSAGLGAWPVRFAARGELVMLLDSKLYQCQWHRVSADADIPEGTALEAETFTSEAPRDLAEIQALPWQRLVLMGELPNKRRAPDRYLWDTRATDALVQSLPGRYLWLRLRLIGSGEATPVVRALRVFFPRRGYLEHLPAVYQQDQPSRWFLERALSVFESTLSGVENEITHFARYFTPHGVPADFLPWLASWLGLALDEHWPEGRKRELIRRAPMLYRLRGTPRGVLAYLRLYTGLAEGQVHLIEHFAMRRWQVLGARSGTVLGGSCPLERFRLDENARPEASRFISVGDPAQDPFAVYAHRFTVVIPASRCSAPVDQVAIERILDAERPAHTEYQIHRVEPRLRVGIQSTVGADTIIGTYPLSVLGTASTLGLNTVLTHDPEAWPSTTQVARRSRVGASTVVG